MHFGGEDIVGQPVHQREVVGDAAQQSHRCMGVPVNKTRHDNTTRAVNRFRCRVLRNNVVCCTDGQDDTVVDCDGCITVHRHRIVHRHNVVAEYDKVDAIVRSGGCLRRVGGIAANADGCKKK